MDLVQEGNRVLLRVAEAFDPERGIPFLALAVPWLRFAFRKLARKEIDGEDGLLSIDYFDPEDHGPMRGPDARPAFTIVDLNALSPEDSAERALWRQRLDDALARLTYREREIVRLRWGLDGAAYSLDDAARVFKITREWARRIEKNALAKLHDNPDLKRLMGETP